MTTTKVMNPSASRLGHGSRATVDGDDGRDDDGVPLGTVPLGRRDRMGRRRDRTADSRSRRLGSPARAAVAGAAAGFVVRSMPRR
ncbi:hypothetical protein [Georgenia thermotolerans]|uniref:hypothetical protein n=1 Tax=Georgenia thermotolerans TaxID=527326 RepID=UPI0014790447|nr:hypothetical protein [Georgenia thermotolerans]